MIIFKSKHKKVYSNRVFQEIDKYLNDNIDGDIKDYSGGLYKTYDDYAVYKLKNNKDAIVKTHEDNTYFAQYIEIVDSDKCKPYIEYTGPIKYGSIYG